jgi:V8-like Glu-specific endopeptidase
MNLCPPSTISALLALSGLATVGWLSSLAPSQAKPSSTQSAQFTVAPSAQAFKLPTASKPFQPTELKKDEKPHPDRGIICKPDQPQKECDDRIPMTNRNYPWSTIGRVIIARANGKFSGCSGVLIQEDIVLTNSHCIVDSTDNKLAKTIQFRPNLINDTVQRQEAVASWENGRAIRKCWCMIATPQADLLVGQFWA